jgi:hypothetical protein
MIERSAKDIDPIINSLENWAFGHAQSDQPFMVVRGRTFTPKTFYEAVKSQSDYAEPFLTYLFERASREDIAPRTLIDRETNSRV